MPPYQQLLTDAQNLEQDIANLLASLPNDPLGRWNALAQIGEKRRQLAKKRLEILAWREQNSAGYEATLVVYDLSGASPPPRLVRLWRMDGASPVVLEDAHVSLAPDPNAPGVFTGSLQLTNAREGVPVALTVQEDGAAAAAGLDLKTGQMEELPPLKASDPSGRIELVLGPVLTLTVDDVQDWLRSVPLPLQTSVPIPTLPMFGESAPAELTVTNLDVTLQQNRIRITGSGTARTSNALVGSLSAPYTLELPITLGLPLSPDAPQLCDVVVRGTPNLSVGGPLGPILSAILPFIVNFLATATLPHLRTVLDRELPLAVASVFGLDGPLEGTTPSLREFSITPTEITLSAALGAFGTVLSDYRP